MKENKKINSNIIMKNHPSFQSKPKEYKPSIKVNYKIVYSDKQNKKQQNFNNKKAYYKNTSNIGLRFNTSVNQINQQPQVKSRVKSIQSSRNQNISGKFHGAQYYYDNQNNMLNDSRATYYSKAKVSETRDKYQHSKSVEQIIKGQYMKKQTPFGFVSSKLQNKKLKTEISQSNSHNMSTSRISSSKYTLSNNNSMNNNNNIKYLKNSQNKDNSNISFNDYRKLASYSQQGIKDIIEYQHAGQYKDTKIITKFSNPMTNNYGSEKQEKQLKNQIQQKFKSFNQIHDFDFRKRINTLITEVNLKGLRG